ncbi:hypothetical protein MBLNU230_g0704t1 [Neophaeotheca triangularis]
MSAAAAMPSPPNGFNNTSRQFNTAGGGAGGGEKAYNHIQDLQASALQGWNPDDPIHILLNTAEQSLRQADISVQFRRPDLGYSEYLRAYEVTVSAIPNHEKHVGYLEPEWARRHKVLVNKINQKEQQFMNIKKIIVDNNSRCGTVPEGYKQKTGHARSQSDAQKEDEMRAPPPHSNSNRHTVHGRLEGSPSGHKVKPSVSPKPQALHGKALSNGGLSQGGDALSERFAKLRMQNGGPDTNPRLSQNFDASSSTNMPSATDWNGRNSFDTSAPPRPQGPRGMANGGSGPTHPGKLPLNTQLEAAMPKAPSPTYSPARNMQTTGNIAPPRHSARSLARNSSLASVSSASNQAPNTGAADSGEYFPKANANPLPQPGPPPRRKSVNVPKETRLPADRLFDYLDRFSILLIDVRPRDEFDQGHIFSQNVICIEPMVLKQGMSAEQLLESLVLSPENEQDMFHHRNEYDLVVYYDGGTSSNGYLAQPQDEREFKLKCLHEALYDFNHDKPLQRPPILLVGGIAAWADLIGQQALVTSNTQSRAKPARPLGRRPLATTNGNSQLRVPKRRLRDYNPLDAEEERSWLEKARVESVVVQPPPVPEDGGNEDSQYSEEPGQYEEESSGSAIRDFLERFPDAGVLDRPSSSTGWTPPTRPAPEPPNKVPMYPSAPTPSPYPPAQPPPYPTSHTPTSYPPAQAPSPYPQVPRRPAPAAPRMSYTGVSERSVSQQTPQRTSSSQLAPYIPPKYLAPNIRLPRTGLVNFGVTCYMNATVQALSATTPLSVFFLDDQFRSLVQRENWKGSKGVLPELYSNLIRSLWKGDVEAIKPSTFRNFCGRLNREWTIDRQQDAKEFFDFLVDCLHEDLNTMWQHNPLRALTETEELKRERMPRHLVARMEWARYTHREQSFLTNLFGGQHASRLRCTTCGTTSTTHEAFYSLSVEIPSPSRRPNGSPIPLTMDDCLRSYCAEEKLTASDEWKCPHCKCNRQATKQITLTRAPQFLVVHFKRFSAGHSQTARKITTPITFPLHALDLEPYMLPPPPSSYVPTPDEPPQDVSATPPYKYDCYAVMRHIGSSLSSGHYTCATRDRVRGCWRMFNDTRVSDFEPERLAPGNSLWNEEAYIVFYARDLGGEGGRGKM